MPTSICILPELRVGPRRELLIRAVRKGAQLEELE